MVLTNHTRLGNATLDSARYYGCCVYCGRGDADIESTMCWLERRVEDDALLDEDRGTRYTEHTHAPRRTNSKKDKAYVGVIT